MSTPTDPIHKTPPTAAEQPDRVAHRAAAHLRRMWLMPFLSAAWLIAEIAALPFSFVKALVIVLIFAGLYFMLSWRLRVMTHVFDQRLRGVTKEHDRIIQAAIREKNGILARAAGLEERIVATVLNEQAQETERADRQQQIEAQQAAVEEAASLWPSLLSVLTRIEQQLSAATDLDDLRQIGARGAFELARAAGFEGRAALYLFDRDGQQLLRMARWPEPVRRRLPGGQKSGPRRVIGLPLRFEPDMIPLPADSAAFWTLYVKRQAFLTEDGALFDTLDDEPIARLALRVPLVSGREPVGHLSLLLTTLPLEPIQDALALVLGSLAGVAALALANASALEDARQVRAEQAFLADLSAHLTASGGSDVTAFLQERLCPLLLADVCAVSLDGKTLDALGHPALQERRDLIHASGLTACSCSAVLQESGKSTQVTERCAVRNPKAGSCLWNRYSGVSGVHCAAAVPIPTSGPVKPALVIYRTGAEGLTSEETVFVKSVAAVLSNRGLEK